MGRGWSAELPVPLPDAPGAWGEHWFAKIFHFSGFLAEFVCVCVLVYTFLPSLGPAAESKLLFLSGDNQTQMSDSDYLARLLSNVQFKSPVGSGCCPQIPVPRDSITQLMMGFAC